MTGPQASGVLFDPCPQHVRSDFPARVYLSGGVPAALSHLWCVDSFNPNPFLAEGQRVGIHYAGMAGKFGIGNAGPGRKRC